jgi:integrase
MVGETEGAKHRQNTGCQKKGLKTMPRKAKELSAIEVKRLEHPGHKNNQIFAVGGVDGLLLQITPGGGRSWLLRCVVGDRRRHIGLGGFPDVTLAGARERAREAREQIRNGIDPIEEKKATRAKLIAAHKRGLTFSEATEKYLVGKLAEFSSEKHKKQTRSNLERYAVSEIGEMLVNDIQLSDVLRVLEPIWLKTNTTAKALREHVEGVLNWSTVSGHRQGDNPARWKGNLDAILPRPSKVSKKVHHPAIALDDAAAWFADIQSHDGFEWRALEFAALTAGRSGEVRGACWNEIDMDKALWIIPAERMKRRKEHRVPLQREALKLLNKLDRMHGVEFVFPAPRGGKMYDKALSDAMKEIHAENPGQYLDRQSGLPAVLHGCRSTFRDWGAERTEYPRELVEIQLAHSVGSEVERAYRRGDQFEKRRGMMSAWGRFLRGEAGAKVVKMERANG